MLGGVLRQRGWEARAEQFLALRLWPQVAGPSLARHALALSVQGGTLLVAVRSGIWATQLGFFQTELLQRLHAAGASSLRDIRFRVGFPRGVADPTAWEEPRPQTDTARQATARERELAAALARDAGSAEVSEAVMRVYLAAKARMRRIGHQASDGGVDTRADG